jgi:hypothetical protein
MTMTGDREMELGKGMAERVLGFEPQGLGVASSGMSLIYIYK